MMPRPRQLVLAASLAALAVGCAHCDTCDDFPAPCTGPNCGYPYQATFPYDADSHIEPIVTGPDGVIYGDSMVPPGAMMAPGTITNAPPSSGAPSVTPPPPTRAEGSPSGGSNGGTSPPDSPPARPNGADPFQLPPPGTSSPFGS